MIRLDAQRTRLLETLEECHELKQRLAIERLILDIDNKMSYTMIKVVSNNDSIEHEVLQGMNEISEDKLEHR